MIPNIHQSIDEIIKESNAEQKILWQQIRLITGENAAIRQLYYSGAILGSEFVTFTLGRMYLALVLGIEGGEASNLNHFMSIYNEAGALFYRLSAVSGYYNSGAATTFYYGNTGEIRNLYFGNVTATANLLRMRFIGYRIIYR